MPPIRYWLQSASFQPDAVIPGTPGDDTLTGTDGADTLNGGLGADLMQGGLGNDSYVVDNAGDSVQEAAGAGVDSVLASISYTLGDNVEALRLGGAAHLTGTGNALNNSLAGNSGNNLLAGLAGNDTLLGYAGQDTLNGGDGSDKIDGGDGNDTLDGGDGDNTVSGGNGHDELHSGRNGAAELYGNAGNDRLYAETIASLIKHATLDGGDGDDLLDASAARSGTSLFGGTGNDTLIGGDPGFITTSSFMRGDAGDDLLMVGDQTSPSRDFSATAYGGTGNDTVQGGSGIDQLDGGSGQDVVSGGGGDDYMSDSDAEADTYDGGDGIDTYDASWMYSSEAVHWVFSSGTHDVRGNTLTGFEWISAWLGRGNDYVDGRLAASTYVQGQGGNDTLIGSDASAADNYLNGGDGNDVLQGGNGAIGLNGGYGNDQVLGGAGDDSVRDDDDNADTLSGGDGLDRISLSWSSATEAVTWVFSTAAQTVNGNLLSGFESLSATGGSGNDYVDARAAATDVGIWGGAGNDTLIGSGESDTFRSEDGSDVLTGGKGRDKFELTSRAGSDTVTDFTTGKDSIDVKVHYLQIGNDDSQLDGATVVEGPGGFSAQAELVIVTGDIDGAITADSAAAAIGSATGAYTPKGKVGAVIFVVDNGVDTAVYHFKAANADAVVSAGELSLLATLVGYDGAVIDDFNWQGGW